MWTRSHPCGWNVSHHGGLFVGCSSVILIVRRSLSSRVSLPHRRAFRGGGEVFLMAPGRDICRCSSTILRPRSSRASGSWLRNWWPKTRCMFCRVGSVLTTAIWLRDSSRPHGRGRPGSPGGVDLLWFTVVSRIRRACGGASKRKRIRCAACGRNDGPEGPLLPPRKTFRHRERDIIPLPA